MRFAAGRQGVQIAYEAMGVGAPVVMLHDYGESSGFWKEFGYVEGFLEHGRQVVLVDLRGHGASAKPGDSADYGPYHWSQDVLDVLDDAGLDRADILGYGLGGRVGLCLAGLASARVNAVAAGGAHPFSEPVQPCCEALGKGLAPWVKLIEAKSGGLSAERRRRLKGNDRAALAAAMQSGQPDMADAVARSSVPLLLFLGKEDPRYPLALSFAEESRAKVIGLDGHGHATAATAVAELLPRLLDFFDRPAQWTPGECLPIGLWSGCWD